MAVLGCVGFLMLLPAGMVVRGLVLAQLWAWFVVPLGAIEISLPWALGLSAVVHLFHGSPVPKAAEKASPGEALGKATFLLLGNPLIGLAVGWMFHTWM